MSFVALAAASAVCPITDSTPACYTASWYLIGDQLRYWGLFQLPIFALSVVYEWLELFNDARLERLRTVFDAPIINVINHIVQVVTCVYVCIAWVVRGGALAVSFSSWSVESVLLIFTAIGYGARWIAAKHKVRFTVQLHSLLDLLSIISHFTISFQTHPVDGSERRSWLDFGFVRTYVLYVVIDHLFTRFQHKTFATQVVLVIFKAFCLVFFAACVLFSLERLGDLPSTNSFLLHVYKCSNSDGTGSILVNNVTGTTEFPVCAETWSFFSSIYFMFVTVSTVGYGDFSPKTVLSQCMVCIIIVVGIYTFANESAALFRIYGDRRSGGVRYNVSRNTAHVIVTGKPSAAQMKDFIREFFHPDHDAMFDSIDGFTEDEVDGADDENAVNRRSEGAAGRYSSMDPVLEEGFPSKHSHVGSQEVDTTRSASDDGVLATKWMQRKGTSRVRETHIVILMRFIEDSDENTEGSNGGAAESSATFQEDVMQFVAENPRYTKRVFFLFGSPLLAKDLERARVHDAKAVFFLPNKFANHGSREDAATVLRVLSVSQHVDRTQTQLFAMLVNSENRMLLEAAGLSRDNLVCADALRLGLMGLSCRCPGLSTLISNLITSRSAELPIDPALSGLVKPWIREYVAGAGNEIYSCTLAPFLQGMTFTQCTQRIHRQSGGQVLLIAVEHETQTFFNPGHAFRIPGNCRAFLIAESMTAVAPFAAAAASTLVSASASVSPLQRSSAMTRVGVERARTEAPSLHIQRQLVARARRAQHTVERRLPQSVRDYVLRCGGRMAALPTPKHPPVPLLLAGGHIVVCSNIGNEGAVGSIARLVSFLRPLRAAHIERIVPVVIVDSEKFDALSWLELSAFDEVYHVVGSPQKHHVLVTAGVYTASAIVVLAQGTEDGYDDSKAIFNAILINAALQQSSIFTIIELRDVHNNKFLDPVHNLRARSATELMGGDGPEDSGHSLSDSTAAPSPHRRFSSHRVSSLSHPSNGNGNGNGYRDSSHQLNGGGGRRSQSMAKKPTWWDHQKRTAGRVAFYVREFFWGSLHTAASRMNSITTAGADVTTAAAALDAMLNSDDNDTFFQERFMYGALFPSYVADDLLIQSFFNPSLNEFIRKILDGTSCFMLYDLPKGWRHGTQTYGELFESMMSGIVSAMPIGLLRAKGGFSGAPHPYVYTSPSTSTILHPDDKVFVLIDVTSIHRVANKLQRRFRLRRRHAKATATGVLASTTSNGQGRDGEVPQTRAFV